MKIKQILMFACITICVVNYSNVYSAGEDLVNTTETESDQIENDPTEEGKVIDQKLSNDNEPTVEEKAIEQKIPDDTDQEEDNPVDMPSEAEDEDNPENEQKEQTQPEVDDAQQDGKSGSSYGNEAVSE